MCVSLLRKNYQEAFNATGVKINFRVPWQHHSNGFCERTNRSLIQNLRLLSLKCKTLDWPNFLPYATWIHNSQISSQTGFSPSELFLGRPTWKFFTIFEPSSNPSVQNWLEEQMLCQEKSRERLEYLRTMALQWANKGRCNSSYTKDYFVLVHKNRWPKRKVSKLESPWFGLFKVHEVFHNTLKVFASPTLGGLVEVSMQHCKKWSSVFDECDEDGPQEENEMFPPSSQFVADQVREESQPIAQSELPSGMYFVKKILKHKYSQGWKFLVHWDGYPVPSSTWEPIDSFILANGSINEVFRDYCQEKDLKDILKRKVEKSKKLFWPMGKGTQGKTKFARASHTTNEPCPSL